MPPWCFCSPEMLCSFLPWRLSHYTYFCCSLFSRQSKKQIPFTHSSSHCLSFKVGNSFGFHFLWYFPLISSKTPNLYIPYWLLLCANTPHGLPLQFFSLPDKSLKWLLLLTWEFQYVDVCKRSPLSSCKCQIVSAPSSSSCCPSCLKTQCGFVTLPHSNIWSHLITHLLWNWIVKKIKWALVLQTKFNPSSKFCEFLMHKANSVYWILKLYSFFMVSSLIVLS